MPPTPRRRSRRVAVCEELVGHLSSSSGAMTPPSPGGSTVGRRAWASRWAPGWGSRSAPGVGVSVGSGVGVSVGSRRRRRRLLLGLAVAGRCGPRCASSQSRMLRLSSASTRRGSSLTCWFAASTAALALAGSSSSQAAVISSIVDVSALARVWGMSSGSSLPQPASGNDRQQQPEREGWAAWHAPSQASGRGGRPTPLNRPYCPCWRRSASESGRLAARIAAWAPAMSYSARR